MRLVAWARAVKSRRGRPDLPPLWLFTDAGRGKDPLAAVEALPAGLCGVVFRHDDVPGRASLARAVARRCRVRRLMMVVAGKPILLPGVGRHLREGSGRRPGLTASAHGAAGLVRARKAGCRAAFLSPVFPTASHAGAVALGPLRWGRLARGRRLAVLALGGIDGATVRRLPRWVAAVGAIGAMAG